MATIDHPNKACQWASKETIWWVNELTACLNFLLRKMKSIDSQDTIKKLLGIQGSWEIWPNTGNTTCNQEKNQRSWK